MPGITQQLTIEAAEETLCNSLQLRRPASRLCGILQRLPPALRAAAVHSTFLAAQLRQHALNSQALTAHPPSSRITLLAHVSLALRHAKSTLLSALSLVPTASGASAKNGLASLLQIPSCGVILFQFQRVLLFSLVCHWLVLCS